AEGRALDAPIKSGFVSFSRFQFADPDVAVAHGMVVVLQRQRQLVGSWFVRRAHMVPGGAGELDVVLHQNAIVKNGFARGARQLSRSVKARAVKNDVVGLPLARGTRSIEQRRILSVGGRGLSVGVGFVLVRVQNLRLVEPVEE